MRRFYPRLGGRGGGSHRLLRPICANRCSASHEAFDEDARNRALSLSLSPSLRHRVHVSRSPRYLDAPSISHGLVMHRESQQRTVAILPAGMRDEPESNGAQWASCEFNIADHYPLHLRDRLTEPLCQFGSIRYRPTVLRDSIQQRSRISGFVGYRSGLRCCILVRCTIYI